MKHEVRPSGASTTVSNSQKVPQPIDYGDFDECIDIVKNEDPQPPADKEQTRISIDCDEMDYLCPDKDVQTEHWTSVTHPD